MTTGGVDLITVMNGLCSSVRLELELERLSSGIMSSYSMRCAFVHTVATHVLVESTFLFPNQRRKLLHAPKKLTSTAVRGKLSGHMVSAIQAWP